MGRTFSSRRRCRTGRRVVVIGSELWQSAFGGRRDIVGSQIEIDGVRRTVIGVMPPRFDVADNHIQVWLPIGARSGESAESRQSFSVLVGRLADGATRTTRAGRARHAARRAGNRRRQASQPAPTSACTRRTPSATVCDTTRCRRRSSAARPRDLGAAGRGRARAADRVREPREPAARARRNAAQRVRRARRARRRPHAAAAPIHDRGPAAVDAGARARARRRGRRRARAARRVSRQPAARRPRSASTPACSAFTLLIGRGDRRGVRARAAAAPARRRDVAGAQGRRPAHDASAGAIACAARSSSPRWRWR